MNANGEGRVFFTTEGFEEHGEKGITEYGGRKRDKDLGTLIRTSYNPQRILTRIERLYLRPESTFSARSYPYPLTGYAEHQ